MAEEIANEPVNASAKVVIERAKKRGMTDQVRRALVRVLDGVPTDLKERLRKHYLEHPFDKIRDGVLSIVNKDGDLVKFVPNQEQRAILDHIESEFDAKRPARARILKSRQVGLSTLSVLILYVLVSSSSHKRAHIVCHLKSTASNLLLMFQNCHRYCPDCFKPKIDKKNKEGVAFDDPEYGVEDSFVHIDSAELRDKLSIGHTYQYNVFSEKAEWPDVAGIAGALKPTIPHTFPSLIIEESTGKMMGDIFYREWWAAYENKAPGWKGFFFRWFEHEEYKRSPEADGLTKEGFLATLLDDEKQMMENFNLSVEQMYWYYYMMQDWCATEAETREVFISKYPSTPEEAFAAAGQNFFDAALVKLDQVRTLSRIEMKLRELPTSCTKHMGQSVFQAHCNLIRDLECDYKNPEFQDNPRGDWLVFERPRMGHKYVITVDIAEGKGRDASVIDIVRYTHESSEKTALVQVAQFRSRLIDPYELAREAKAASVLYAFKADAKMKPKPALVMPERNGPGIAFINEGCRLGIRFYMKTLGAGRYRKETSEEIGFQSTGGEAFGTKFDTLVQAREVWRQSKYIVNSVFTAKEMGTYAQNGRKCEAIPPHHDDTVTTFFFGPEAVRKDSGSTGPKGIENTVIAPENGQMRTLEAPPKINMSQWLGPEHKTVKQGGFNGIAI